MKTRNTMMAALLGLAAGSAGALSLGPADGRVLLGEPIDVSFEVHLDAGMELETACLAAEIVSGENRLGRGQVQVTPLPEATGRRSAVRVQSSQVADEPVLTIRLSAGCSGSITRSYVFLVDLPDSISPSNTPIAIPWVAPLATTAAPARDVADGVGNLATSDKQPSRRSSVSSPRPSVESAAVKVQPPPARVTKSSAPAARTRPPKAPVAAASQAGAAKPRLVMEPLAIEPGLATSTSAAASAPVSAPAASLPASAAEDMMPPVPGAPASQPEATSDSPAVKQLKDELASLRKQVEADRAAELALRLRLERIESERFQPGVVHGLLGLVAVLLAWMVWQILRFRTAFEQSSQAWNEYVATYDRRDSRSQAG